MKKEYMHNFQDISKMYAKYALASDKPDIKDFIDEGRMDDNRMNAELGALLRMADALEHIEKLVGISVMDKAEAIEIEHRQQRKKNDKHLHSLIDARELKHGPCPYDVRRAIIEQYWTYQPNIRWAARLPQYTFGRTGGFSVFRNEIVNLTIKALSVDRKMMDEKTRKEYDKWMGLKPRKKPQSGGLQLDET